MSLIIIKGGKVFMGDKKESHKLNNEDLSNVDLEEYKNRLDDLKRSVKSLKKIKRKNKKIKKMERKRRKILKDMKSKKHK